MRIHACKLCMLSWWMLSPDLVAAACLCTCTLCAEAARRVLQACCVFLLQAIDAFLDTARMGTAQYDHVGDVIAE